MPFTPSPAAECRCNWSIFCVLAGVSAAALLLSWAAFTQYPAMNLWGAFAIGAINAFLWVFALSFLLNAIADPTPEDQVADLLAALSGAQKAMEAAPTSPGSQPEDPSPNHFEVLLTWHWTTRVLDREVLEQLNDQAREQITRMVQRGFTQGELFEDHDGVDYRGWWTARFAGDCNGN